MRKLDTLFLWEYFVICFVLIWLVLILMSMNIRLGWIDLCTACVCRSPQGSEKHVGTPRTGDTNGYEPPHILGTELRSSARVISFLNCSSVSSLPLLGDSMIFGQNCFWMFMYIPLQFSNFIQDKRTHLRGKLVKMQDIKMRWNNMMLRWNISSYIDALELSCMDNS